MSEKLVCLMGGQKAYDDLMRRVLDDNMVGDKVVRYIAVNPEGSLLWGFTGAPFLDEKTGYWDEGSVSDAKSTQVGETEFIAKQPYCWEISDGKVYLVTPETRMVRVKE